MSEGSISQEEIDALLSGVDMGGLGSGGSFSSVPDTNIDTATLQKFSDGMKGKLAEIIKSMTQKDVIVDGATVDALGRDELLARLPEVVVAVMADYSAGLTGDHLFLMSTEFATKLVSLINQEENPALDDMGLSVVSEVISSHSGAEITELSKDGKLPGLAANPPEAVNQPKAMIRIPQGTFALFTYSGTLDGEPFTLWEAVGGSVAEGMAKALGGGTQKVASPDMSAASMAAAAGFSQQPMMGAQNPAGMQQSAMMGMGQPNMGMQQNPMMGMGQPNMGMQQSAMMGMGQPNMGMQQNAMMGMQQPMMGMQQMQTPPSVQALQFPNFQQSVPSGEQGNIGLIMDVFMEMTVELGRTKKTIKDILGLGEGTIIELDKLAGEPVDILVNHKTIARGEVVVIDESFGVRVTEILPAMDHVASSI